MNKTQNTNQPSTKRMLMGFAALAGAALCLQLAKDAKAESQPVPDRTQLRKRPTERPVIEVAFVLDTTGSMGGLLEGAKQKIWSVASRIAAGQPTPRLRVGLVAYRDKGDDYVTQVYQMTEDLDAVYENLRSFQPDGGGDTPEHVGQGLGEAVKNLQWSSNPKVMKLIFVVGDAPPQQYQDGWSYRKWTKSALQKGIVVNTVQCGSDATTRNSFLEIAKIGTGTFASIDASGGMIATRTPYDDEIASLNGRISTMSLYAGRAPARSKAEARSKAMADMPAEAAADRVGYMAKKREATGTGGIAAAPASPGVRDLLADDKAIDEVSEEELPATLKGKSKAERKAEVKKLAKERTQLEKKVVELSKKRDQWIKSNVDEKEDSFDANVMKDIRNRGAKYGIAY